MPIRNQPSTLQVNSKLKLGILKIGLFQWVFKTCRLKAIQKQSGHVKPDTDEEKAELRDLNKDLLRRNEQIGQVHLIKSCLTLLII